MFHVPVTGASFNSLNQLTSLNGASGPMLFSGSLDKPGTLTVNGASAFVNPHTTNFTGYAAVAPGTNVVSLVAADSYANSRTNRYQIIVTNNGVSETLSYDLNGNLLSTATTALTNTYEWDAVDRLTAINSGTNRSEFTYDGSGRRVQILEKQNGTPVSTNKFIWCGMEMCEQRDGTGTNVLKRFSGQGEQISGTNYFFSRDHLGSVREITDTAGAIRVRYDYDPYGRRSKIEGDLDSDFGFTGHYIHSISALCLAPFRSYDPGLGRWLSRDPISEAGGPNLYAYVANNPIMFIDPYGLSFWGDFGNGLNNTVSGIGQSMGQGLYDLSHLTWSQNEYNRIGDLMYSTATPENPAATPYIEGALGVSAAAATTAALALGGEAAASRGCFKLSEHALKDSIGQEGRYWSEIAARNAIRNGPRMVNFGGETPYWNALTTFRYPIGNGGQIVLNPWTRTIVQYLPKW